MSTGESRRRTDAKNGYVDFPVNRPGFHNTGEGGIFVRLVVVDTADDIYDEWVLCCGGYQKFSYDECLMGDDVHKRDSWTRDGHIKSPTEDFHFPHMREEYDPTPFELEDPQRTTEAVNSWNDYYKWRSRRYLAVLTIGSTGWSIYDDQADEYWLCTYSDLTTEGQALYDSLQQLYAPNGKLFLQTWLDT